MARRPSPVSSPTFNWQDRIVELRYMLPSEVDLHPLQHKSHPDSQKAVVLGSLEEVGVTNALRVYQSPSTGRWTYIDGHLRQGLAERPWPSLVLDVNDEEAAYLLAIDDEIAGLAVREQDRTARLLDSIRSENAAVQQLLQAVALQAGSAPPDFQPVGIEEQGRLDERAPLECPACGHTWTP